MKSGDDVNTSPGDINNWLGFSLSPHMKMESNVPSATNFYLPNSSAAAMYDQSSDFHHQALSVMPLKSDGSLCIMEALSRSHPQGAVMPNSTTSSPKLEDFLGGASMAAHYSLHPRNLFDLTLDTSFYQHQQQQQQQQHYFSNFNFYQTTPNEDNDKNLQLMQIPQMSEEGIPCLKTWMDQHHHLQGNNSNNTNTSILEDRSAIQSLSLSMSPGSQSSSITASRQISPTETTECAAIETKKRGAQKLGQKQTVHRKSIDTFGQRTSQYRGVTRHRWTGRYEAHLWDNSCKKEGQTRKGRQVYLGGYDMEDKAARAYDLAALKYWGPATHINFALENYHQELEDMKNMSRQEYVAHLRRKSSGFSRGASIYRGVTRHHQHGRWQARIGRVAGNKDLYLGTFSTQEEAAEAYDIAAIKFRGVNAVTNFDISRYDVEKIMTSNTLPTGEVARRNKESRPVTVELPVDELCSAPSSQAERVSSACDWKMVLHNEAPTSHESVNVKTLDLGNYHNNPPFSVGFHDLMGHDSSQAGVVEEAAGPPMAPHFSNASSLVTSLSSSREASPDRYGGPSKFMSSLSNVNAWIPTSQLRPGLLTTAHLPVFAAWNDA